MVARKEFWQQHASLCASMFYKSTCITDNIDIADGTSDTNDELVKGYPKPSQGREKNSFDRLVIHL